MTSLLIGLGLSDNLCCHLRQKWTAADCRASHDQLIDLFQSLRPPVLPFKGKMDCCHSRDQFGCWVTGCSTTRIRSLSISGCQQQQIGEGVGGVLSLRRSVVGIFYRASRQDGGFYV